MPSLRRIGTWAALAAFATGAVAVWLVVGRRPAAPPAAPVTRPGPDPYWLSAREKTYRSIDELLARHQAELAREIAAHVLAHGDRSRREVALTFDDGPHPEYTPKLLEILHRNNVQATFFVVGEMAEQAPELIRAEAAAGHVVGNHTYHHVNLTRIPEDAVATEIQACGDVIESITGTAPHFFRPPGGDFDRAVLEAAEALGYTTVLWTDDPADYRSPGEVVIEARTLTEVRDGGIILLHDGVQQTVDVLPRIIEMLRAANFSFVTVEQMARREVVGGEGQRPGPSRR